MHALVRIYSRLAPNLLLIFEAVQVIAVVAWIFLSQQRLANSAEPRSFRAFSRSFSNLARRRVLCVVLTGASVLAIRVALIPLLGVPEPIWHDEYSFLLPADTSPTGRLTNPHHRLGILFYCMNSYFAGSPTALAGALVLGSLPRIQRHRRLRDAAVMGIGLATLANTRPSEGLVFSLPIAMAMSVWWARQKQIPTLTVMQRVVLPLILILGVTGAAMGYYFWRVTGHPLLMPYQVDRQTYAMAPYFIWQHSRPEPFYRPAAMRDFYQGWEYHDYLSGTTPLGLVRRLLYKLYVLWKFYAGPALTIPLLAFPCIFRDRKMRFPLVVAGFAAAGIVREAG